MLTITSYYFNVVLRCSLFFCIMQKNETKILIADDEPDIREILSYNLSREGFIVTTVSSASEAIKKASNNEFDLIILDIMMPGKDGIEACRELRRMEEYKNKLIVFLTARAEEYSEVAGFDVGADDYITKPIKPRAFIGRIKALIRRGAQVSSSEAIEIGSLKVIPETHIIEMDGKQFDLPKKEFKLIELLASKPGRVFTRDQILNQIWGRELIVGDRTIDVHIRKIRKKLGEDLIKTIKGIGYKLDL